MAVSWMTSTHDHAVRTFFEGTKDEHRVDTAGTWNTDDLYICRVTNVSGGYALPETLEKILELSIENLERYEKGETLHNIIDFSTGYVKR